MAPRTKVRELTPEEQSGFKERRQERRVPCNLDLRVAAYDGVMQPERMDYIAMQGRDISDRGISFFAPSPPDTERVVLMLGDYRDAHYITARVVRSLEGFWNRRRQFVIGCAIDGQLPPPS